MRRYIKTIFGRQVEEFTSSQEFVALEEGSAGRADYDHFLANVFSSHAMSPHFLSFLFSLAPPASAEAIKHNLLEELGLEEEDGISHPALLERLMRDAGMAGRLDELRDGARRRLSDHVRQPILYASLREVGLSALVQIVAFEYMLSRVASRIARFLHLHRDVPEQDLVWFTHHAEVDVRHAEEGIDNILAHIEAYDFDPEEARDIVDVALRENIFIKSYFGAEAAIRRGRAA
ncbi:MAG: iron-containing redox enzyme family protein [Alphaproteobacteria bacterium]